MLRAAVTLQRQHGLPWTDRATGCCHTAETTRPTVDRPHYGLLSHCRDNTAYRGQTTLRAAVTLQRQHGLPWADHTTGCCHTAETTRPTVGRPHYGLLSHCRDNTAYRGQTALRDAVTLQRQHGLPWTDRTTGCCHTAETTRPTVGRPHYGLLSHCRDNTAYRGQTVLRAAVTLQRQHGLPWTDRTTGCCHTAETTRPTVDRPHYGLLSHCRDNTAYRGQTTLRAAVTLQRQHGLLWTDHTTGCCHTAETTRPTVDRPHYGLLSHCRDNTAYRGQTTLRAAVTLQRQHGLPWTDRTTGCCHTAETTRPTVDRPHYGLLSHCRDNTAYRGQTVLRAAVTLQRQHGLPWADRTTGCCHTAETTRPTVDRPHYGLLSHCRDNTAYRGQTTLRAAVTLQRQHGLLWTDHTTGCCHTAETTRPTVGRPHYGLLSHCRDNTAYRGQTTLRAAVTLQRQHGLLWTDHTTGCCHTAETTRPTVDRPHYGLLSHCRDNTAYCGQTTLRAAVTLQRQHGLPWTDHTTGCCHTAETTRPTVGRPHYGLLSHCRDNTAYRGQTALRAAVTLQRQHGLPWTDHTTGCCHTAETTRPTVDRPHYGLLSHCRDNTAYREQTTLRAAVTLQRQHGLPWTDRTTGCCHTAETTRPTVDRPHYGLLSHCRDNTAYRGQTTLRAAVTLQRQHGLPWADHTTGCCHTAETTRPTVDRPHYGLLSHCRDNTAYCGQPILRHPQDYLRWHTRVQCPIWPEGHTYIERDGPPYLPGTCILVAKGHVCYHF